MLRATDSVGSAFPLCCARHPDTDIKVSQPDDFSRLSPEGGCQLSCDRRLPSCGHRCEARCHSESMHKIFACPKPCERLHKPCNHSCLKATCGDLCGLCLTKLDNIELPCGHIKDQVECYRTQDVGHIKCTVLVPKTVPVCNHSIETECYRDPTAENFICPAPCGALLPCGHVCASTCGKCNGLDEAGQMVVKHPACTKVCGRKFGSCNHSCQRSCHEGEGCRPCFSQCEVNAPPLHHEL